MAMTETFPGNRTGEIREGLLRDIVAAVEERGFLELTLDHRLDDEPLTWQQEFIQFFVPAMTRTGTAVPEHPKPKTLHGEIQRICLERGWTLHFNPRTYVWGIMAPLKKSVCAKCHGRGRVPRLLPLSEINAKSWDSLMSQQVEHIPCEPCAGTGEIATR